ncbi:S1C family serine protease [Capillimicrobium parvum]|uniref:S1C family serine protease n=1 Tax=Capillimicrobium parvum TaxID=2884022 RepID=UPI00216ADD8B|nr:S1C family serine protease [Capillimicrobium parvum]
MASDRVLVFSHTLAGDRVELDVAGDVKEGKVLASDLGSGLSVLETQTGGVEALRWSPVTPNLGDPVFALGDPGTGLRVTEGRVSADLLRVRGRGGRLVSAIEHTAPMPRGAGGGPLVNAAGELIGINALRGDPGFLIALAAESARAASDRLLRGEPDVARLGVAVAPPRAARRMRRAVGLPDRAGVLVRDVEAGSAAEAGGVLAGDLIVAVGNEEVQHPDALVDTLQRVAGTTVALHVVRGVDEHRLEVDLSAKARA